MMPRINLDYKINWAAKHIAGGYLRGDALRVVFVSAPNVTTVVKVDFSGNELPSVKEWVSAVGDHPRAGPFESTDIAYLHRNARSSYAKLQPAEVHHLLNNKTIKVSSWFRRALRIREGDMVGSHINAADSILTNPWFWICRYLAMTQNMQPLQVGTFDRPDIPNVYSLGSRLRQQVLLERYDPRNSRWYRSQNSKFVRSQCVISVPGVFYPVLGPAYVSRTLKWFFNGPLSDPYRFTIKHQPWVNERTEAECWRTTPVNVEGTEVMLNALRPLDLPELERVCFERRYYSHYGPEWSLRDPRFAFSQAASAIGNALVISNEDAERVSVSL